MVRSIVAIAWAILMCRPGLTTTQAISYASVIKASADAHSYDAFGQVALVYYESSWRTHVTGDGGRAIGLGQIWYQHVGACKIDPQPFRDPGPRCWAVRNSLFNGSRNLQVLGSLMGTWQRRCEAETGRGRLRDIVSGHAGLSRPPGRWCGRMRMRGAWRDLSMHFHVARIVKLTRALDERWLIHTLETERGTPLL